MMHMYVHAWNVRENRVNRSRRGPSSKEEGRKEEDQTSSIRQQRVAVGIDARPPAFEFEVKGFIVCS